MARSLEEMGPWLVDRGADVLSNTSEWEILRWKANGTTSVIYKNKRGRHTYTGEADEAVRAWKTGTNYRVEKTTRRSLTVQMRSVLARDGSECFFCGRDTPEDDSTLEHLISLSAGGPNHTSNLAIAHRECNAMGGSMSVAEKVRLRDELRTGMPPQPPPRVPPSEESPTPRTEEEASR